MKHVQTRLYFRRHPRLDEVQYAKRVTTKEGKKLVEYGIVMPSYFFTLERNDHVYISGERLDRGAAVCAFEVTKQ